MAVSAELDFAAVAVSTARGLSGTSSVQGTLVFRVANQVDNDCGGQVDVVDPTDAAADFVTLAPNPGSVDAASFGTAQFCVVENARFGFAVSYRDAALGGPAKGFSDGVHEFPVANQFTVAPGAEQFGFNLRANTTPVVGGDPEFAGALSDLTNADYATANRFSYDDTGNSLILATKSGPSTVARYTLSYVADIAASTPGGTYLAHQLFTCTATF